MLQVTNAIGMRETPDIVVTTTLQHSAQMKCVALVRVAPLDPVTILIMMREILQEINVTGTNTTHHPVVSMILKHSKLKKCAVLVAEETTQVETGESQILQNLNL